MKEFKNKEDSIELELNAEAIKTKVQIENPEKHIDLEEESLGVCWGVKALDICIKSVSDKKVVLDVKLAGQNIGRITLTPKDACVKIKESIGGDAAKVSVKICANFAKKEIRADGKVCALWVCAKFNQRILKW